MSINLELTIAQGTRPKTIKNLPLEGSSKRLSQFYSCNRWTYKAHFFHFSIFTILLITKES